MIKAVVFDWFGVVTPQSKLDTLDQLSLLTTLPKDALRSFFTSQSALLKIGKINSETFLQRLNDTFSLDLQSSELETVWASESDSKPDSLLLTVLEEIKDRGLKGIVLSNTFPHTELLIQQNKWYDYFDACFLSSSSGLAKPDAAFFEHMMHAAGFAPEELLFLDDQIKNTAAAEKLRISAIQITGKNRAHMRELINEKLSS